MILPAKQGRHNPIPMVGLSALHHILVVGTWVGADDPRMHFQTTAQGQGRGLQRCPLSLNFYNTQTMTSELMHFTGGQIFAYQCLSCWADLTVTSNVLIVIFSNDCLRLSEK